MRRVVITGMGITSCLGNDLDTVSAALREGRSGITALADHAEAGLRSQVGGRVDLDLEALIDRKQKRFMSDAAAFAYLAMRDAIADAGLFLLCVPKALGGAEIDFPTQVRIAEVLGLADASTAWAVDQGMTFASFSAYMQPDTAREIWTNTPRSVVSNTPEPTGKAIVDHLLAEGYLVDDAPPAPAPSSGAIPPHGQSRARPPSRNPLPHVTEPG